MKFAPSIEYKHDMVPVDFVSSIIIDIILQKKNIEKTYHIFNMESAMSLKDISQIMATEHQVTIVSLEEWINVLESKQSK